MPRVCAATGQRKATPTALSSGVRSIPLLFGPELIGTVVSGYEIGDALAANIKRFANSEVVFFTKTADGFEQAGSKLADTETLASWLAAETMPAEAEDVRIELAGETYQAVFAPLLTVDGEGVGVFAALRSRDRELAAFRSFQRSVALAGLLGIGLAVLASHLVARGLAQPIRDLVEVTNRIREGDYASDVEIRSADEIGALAKSFRVLLRELRKKQEMEKFISQSAAEMIQRSGANIGAGERQPVTVLFSDLKSHAAFRDGASGPVDVLSRVNDALSRQAELVKRYGGLVDKFIGDRMMAVFKGGDRVWPAIRCAISIQHLMELDDEEPDNVLVPGIGVSAGDVVFGAVGSSDPSRLFAARPGGPHRRTACLRRAPRGRAAVTRRFRNGQGSDIRRSARSNEAARFRRACRCV